MLDGPRQMVAARPIPADRVPYWHLLPFSIFLLGNIYIWVWHYDRLVIDLAELGVLRLILLGMATYRIANIIANEQVFKVVRAPFVDVRPSPAGEEEVPKRRGIRNTVGTLLFCPSCLGVWTAAALVYSLIFFPQVTWVVTLIFALSAAERILTNFIFWIDRLGERAARD